jgi:hypothetical protein
VERTRDLAGFAGSPVAINIKPENRGKFTASSKRAGESVQEHAKSVLSNPHASAKEKKRANFARNAKKWNHRGKKRGKGRSTKRSSRR